MRSIQQAFDVLTQAALPRLSRDELETLADAHELAQLVVDQARTVFEGIGCLVSSDGDTGTFTDRNDAADLAFLCANLFDLAGGLLSLSNQVGCALDVKAGEVKK